MAGRLGPGGRGGGAAAGRGGGQVGPASAADLAARRHGRPDARQRPDPRRHDGDRRRLPDRPHARALRAGAGRAAAGGRHRRGHAAAGRLQRPDPARHQARAGLLDDQPDRLHVPGPGRGGLVGGHLPLHDPRLLQGPALPGGRRGHPRPARGARHVQDGRPAAAAAADLLDLPDRRARRWPPLPLVTAGFYSKDLILYAGLGLAARAARGSGRPGWSGAFLTSLYTFRMVFLTFFGPAAHGAAAHGRALAMGMPLVVLAVLSHRRRPGRAAAHGSGGRPLLTTSCTPPLPAPGARARSRRHEPGCFSSSAWPSLLAASSWRTCCSCASPQLVRALAAHAAGRAGAPLLVRRLGLRLALRRAVRPAVRLGWPGSTGTTSSTASTALIGWLSARPARGCSCRTQTGESAGTPAASPSGRSSSSRSWCCYDPGLADRRFRWSAGLLGWLAGPRSAAPGRAGSPWLAMAAELALALSASGLSAPAHGGRPAAGRWLAEVDWPWIPQLGIRFHLAMDGLSLLLVSLTALPGHRWRWRASWTRDPRARRLLPPQPDAGAGRHHRASSWPWTCSCSTSSGN